MTGKLDVTPLARLYAQRRLARLAHLNPSQTQAGQLLALTRSAATTRFGRKHGFADVRSVADYQERVPLANYDDFWRDYWQASFPILDDATWPGRIGYFAFTSGTSSGTGKAIPVSKAMVSANRRAAFEVMAHHLVNRKASRMMGGKSFILGGSTDLAELAPGIFRGDLSGIAAHEVPAFARPWSFPPPDQALEMDWEAKIDRLARLSLAEDIRAISGTPSWVLLFFEYLARIAGKPMEARVLYPKLEVYVHGGIGFRPYRQRFDQLFVGGHVETREVYPASEGFIAIADRAPGQGLRMLLDNGLFYEFVPLAELSGDRPTRHWIGNAETGVDYALVLTTCAGLWSYVLGDVVRLVDRSPPRLLVTGRVSYQLNTFGEHLSAEQIDDAMEMAARKTGRLVYEYAVGPDFPDGALKGRHLVVVELSPGADGGLGASFATAFDQALSSGSLDYRERRVRDVGLDPPQIIQVPAGFFAGWMKRRGRMGGQNKVPRVITDEALLVDLVNAARGVRAA